MPFGHYVEIRVPSSAFRKCQQAPGNLFTFHLLLFEKFYRRPQTALHEAQVACFFTWTQQEGQFHVRSSDQKVAIPPTGAPP